MKASGMTRPHPSAMHLSECSPSSRTLDTTYAVQHPEQYVCSQSRERVRRDGSSSKQMGQTKDSMDLEALRGLGRAYEVTGDGGPDLEDREDDDSDASSLDELRVGRLLELEAVWVLMGGGGLWDWDSGSSTPASTCTLVPLSMYFSISRSLFHLAWRSRR